MNKCATMGRISRKAKEDMEPHASFYKQGNLVLDLMYGEIGSSTKTLPYYELYG